MHRCVLRSSILMLLILLAVPIVVGQTEEVLPTVDQVLKRYVEAIGGSEAIEKLTSRDCRGQLTHDLSSRKPPVHEEVQFSMISKVPNCCLLMFNRAGQIKRAGFDGTVGWRQRDGKISVDESVGRDKLAWLINPQNAQHIEEYFPELFVGGTEVLGNKTVVVLEPVNLDKTYFALYFDTETGLLVRIGYYWNLKDYRPVDGVLFPHRIVTSRKGGTSTYDFHRVKHNAPFDDAMFAAPESGETGNN